MQIIKIEIHNFRSISDISLTVSELAAVCGPNSCGKSNLLRAIKFSFLESYSSEEMAKNIPTSLTSPNAATKIKLYFDTPTNKIATVLSIPKAKSFTFTVAVKKNGTSKSYVNGSSISDITRRDFVSHILVIRIVWGYFLFGLSLVLNIAAQPSPMQPFIEPEFGQ